MGETPRRPEPPKTIRIGAIGAQSDRGPQRAFLTVIRGGGSDLGMNTVVEKSVTLGRAPECELSLMDLGISWKHVRVTPTAQGICVLEDLGSTNGTRINGKPVEGPWLLKDGEKIFLGQTVVRFSVADAIDESFQNEVAQLVGTDPLTGLESKRRFDDALDYAIQNAQQADRPVAMLMMDMDGVKQINDTHGHLFGAHVIGQCGRIIAAHMGADGHACRFGGDEFSAFLPNQTKEEARETAETIRKAVESAGMEKDGIPLAPTISIGLAGFPVDAENSLDLVASADQALYRAKADGKNCVAL